MKEDMCEEEYDDACNSESELEDDLFCRIFDGWAHCVYNVRSKLSEE